MAYRYDIGLNSHYQFGAEIEFANVGLIDLYEMLLQEKLPVEYMMHHKTATPGPTFKRWVLDTDFSVTKSGEQQYIGGELSSRILRDYTSTWLELHKICKVLRKSGAQINDFCSNHITVNLSDVENMNRFLEFLSKVLIVYESEIETFYRGEIPRERATKDDYAKSLAYRLSREINDIDFSSPRCLFNLTDHHDLYRFRDAISLDKYARSKLMEVRYPNGTMNEEVIQNNINFTMKLIDAIISGKFDIPYLDRQIDKFDVISWMRVDANPHKMGELIEIISNSEKDRVAFNAQFQRVRKR